MDLAAYFHPENIPQMPEPEILNDPAYWLAAFHYSRSMHAVPCMAYFLSKNPIWGKIPVETKTMFEQELTQQRMSAALLDEALVNCALILQKADIPVLAIKGIDLARRVYPSRLLRPMGDLDLLIPIDRFETARNILFNSGYNRVQTMFEHSYRGTITLNGMPVFVDLHKQLMADDTAADLDQYWKSAKTNDVFKDLTVPVHSLNIGDCFLYTLRHAAYLHTMESLTWFYDLHFLMKKPLPWDWIITRLTEKKSLAAALLVFEFMKKNWNSNVPDSILNTLHSKAGWSRSFFAKTRRSKLEQWYPNGARSFVWLFFTKYMNRQNAIQAINYGLKRAKRIYLENKTLRSANSH